MGYLHIPNLYKNTEILLFKECYAMEKVHGTSARIVWKNNKLQYVSGGMSYATFTQIPDFQFLNTLLIEEFLDTDLTIFGEAYGGKEQGMSAVYGKVPSFIVFEVMIGDVWLNVPNAEDVANKLNLEFVPYEKVSTDLDSLNAERDRDSIVAIRRGMGEGKLREGVVLKPLIEMTKNNGDRIIVKHKRAEFLETATKREVDPEKLKILEDAKAISDEWVTPLRLAHVLDKLGNPSEIEQTGVVIKAMIEDVLREAEREIKESKEAIRAIGQKTAVLYKNKINKLKELEIE